MSQPSEEAVRRESAIQRLRSAYQGGDLTLYLGAGVSVASGLPSWEKLVLTMYYSAIGREGGITWLDHYYLYEIAEWHLQRAHEPLEVTARKIRQH